MKRSVIAVLLLMFVSLGFQSCKDGGGSPELEDTDLVESGTYTGIATEVDDEEKEIYFETEDGEVLELYFTDQTEVLRGESPVTFEELEQGQELEVTVEKVGKRLDPVRVLIIE